ncbi:unannotated protein [freshwater metagenome]|uniref:Unannotated protein n=1 Tax=freshwater metagenome TaxID=449393 RepID=A0A6J6GVF0_9ZZZZ
MPSGHENDTSCSSTPFEPSRCEPSARVSSPARAGASGRASTSAVAAAIRAFGLLVRAGAPRRSQASSRVARLRRVCSAASACASRSVRPSRYAAYPEPACRPAGTWRYDRPRSSSSTSVVTRSRTWRSWVTISSPPRNAASRCSRNAIASRSRWFVGSSRISRSCSSASRRASAVRLACPPDSPDVSASRRPPIPRRSSMASPCHPCPTASRTVPAGRSGRWGSTPMRAPRPHRTVPIVPSGPGCGSISRASIRSSVVLPEPLMPTTPMRSPGSTVIDTSVNSGRSGRLADRREASRRLMCRGKPRSPGPGNETWRSDVVGREGFEPP